MSHKLSWNKLLSASRVPSPQKEAVKEFDRSYVEKDRRTAFEADYDRIVFSLPFRRLARKTQVHPMASNDHIHNRLIHSLEVASVGRTFADLVVELAGKESDLSENAQLDVSWILQSACLIHDIGNPPFGHAGEEVVRAWVQEHLDEYFSEDAFENEEQRNQCVSDCLNFEGNAQGFRVAARRDNAIAGYLRLTYATLSSAIKYPWLSTDPRTERKKKHNVYTSESELFQQISAELGLSNKQGEICRHPLSFLTEAADDICYRILDLEDAVEMGICKRRDVHRLFLDISNNPNNAWMSLPQIRGQAIQSLIEEFWNVFETNFRFIMNGEREDDLKASLDKKYFDLLNEVNQFYDDIFGHRKKIATELGAYHILGRVLKSLFKTIQSIVSSTDYEQIHFLSKRCIELTWGQDHVQQNLEKNYSWWVQQVMDYVSGMTDDYAMKVSGEIGGFSLDMK
ncbi:Deoxyguanosinetriphosphate triphosphohydrolase [Gimesia alba]|uniref:Deoxyguanosinetriphosphate triphosphohydrolase n=1 Tax=Gimesia alba TaxID=2527973 RepID=A0A517RJ05_9PLAN|nr:dNTP triphosphohydrolase [Gimesia alba]QDT43848.1 Deoxyguanosinetriphosphate triphosphohydrolase [Gimesia alba]